MRKGSLLGVCARHLTLCCALVVTRMLLCSSLDALLATESVTRDRGRIEVLTSPSLGLRPAVTRRSSFSVVVTRRFSTRHSTRSSRGSSVGKIKSRYSKDIPRPRTQCRPGKRRLTSRTASSDEQIEKRARQSKGPVDSRDARRQEQSVGYTANSSFPHRTSLNRGILTKCIAL